MLVEPSLSVAQGQRTLSRIPASHLLLLGGACLLALTPFFLIGSPSGHDFEFHMFSWMDVLGQWHQGVVYPRWATQAHWGYGEARFLFYPPASWVLGAALGALLPWKMVPGVYCWIALMASGLAMIRLTREWLSPSDAMFAAVFYALNPYHLLIVYWRSAYAELLAGALLPLLFLCMVRLAEPGFRPTLGLSLVLAAAWMTNVPAALMIHYSVAGLASLLALRALIRDRAWTGAVWRPLVRTALAALIAAGLASFYLIPVIREQHWINVGEVLSLGVRPQDNFLFTTIDDVDHNRFNRLVSTMGVVEVGLLAIAIWFSRRRRTQASAHSPWMALGTWGTTAGLLMFPVSNLLWQHLPKLRFVQLPFRWLLCLNAALALLLTLGLKRWMPRALLLVLLPVFILVIAWKIQPPWWDTASDIREMSSAMAANTGYEGTDEYVPAGADPYEVKKDTPYVADSEGKAIRAEFMDWSLPDKHFVIQAAEPRPVTMRVFNYPAWEVTVNGKIAPTQTSDVTGQMVIELGKGRNEVRLHFGRTRDRTVADIFSLISVALFGAAWQVMRRSRVEVESLRRSVA